MCSLREARPLPSSTCIRTGGLRGWECTHRPTGVEITVCSWFFLDFPDPLEMPHIIFCFSEIGVQLRAVVAEPEENRKRRFSQ